MGRVGPRHPGPGGDRHPTAYPRPRCSPSLVCALLGVALLLAACGMPAATKGASAPKSVPTTGAPTRRSTTTTTGPGRVSGFLAQSASFVTESDGYVLGDADCSVGTCTALLHTTDRGVAWSTLSAPPTAISYQGAGGVSGLHFADQLDGWAYGDTLWATHDGGNTWNQLRLGGSIVAMASGLGVAYALVQACASCSAPADSIPLFRSRAGAPGLAAVCGTPRLDPPLPQPGRRGRLGGGSGRRSRPAIRVGGRRSDGVPAGHESDRDSPVHERCAVRAVDQPVPGQPGQPGSRSGQHGGERSVRPGVPLFGWRGRR